MKDSEEPLKPIIPDSFHPKIKTQFKIRKVENCVLPKIEKEFPEIP